MHHKCNIRWECSSHTQQGMGNLCGPLGRMYYPLQGRKGHIAWQEGFTKYTQIYACFSYLIFFFLRGFEERLYGMRRVD